MAKRQKSEARKGSAAAMKHQITDHERKTLGKHIDRLDAAPAAPRVEVTSGNGAAMLTLDHPDDKLASALLMEALGTASSDFLNGLLHQLINAGSESSEPDEKNLNFMLAVIKDIKPNDQLEAMLAAQMAVVHMNTMRLTRRLVHTETIPQQDSTGNLLTKLLRTFAAQMEALKRYRTGGEQKVTVQHVSVNEGGQAIVGNVNNQAPKETPSPVNASTPALTKGEAVPMPQIDNAKFATSTRRRKR